jgi:SET domain-containing protein
MDNLKAEARKHPKFDIGVYAKERILKGEEVASFDGEEYTGYYDHEMPPQVLNHGIQISMNKVRNSRGIARLINHSCEPNSGIKDLLRIVAMRDIEVGEEVLWDYDMSENAEWKMKCDCGSERCRKIVGGFRFLPQELRDEYDDYISEWLTKAQIPVFPVQTKVLTGQ